MRRQDRNAGSIKALIIVGLIAANLVAANLRHPAPGPSERNDEIRMTKPESMTNDEARNFVIRAPSLFRASSFELRH